MQRISPFTFCLCFAVFLLGTAPWCSASAPARWLQDLQATYRAAMQTYKHPRDRKPIMNINGDTISPPKALKQLKKEIRLSPTICLSILGYYLRGSLYKNGHRYFPPELSRMVSGFLVQKGHYQPNMLQLLKHAVQDGEWPFLTKWLEIQMHDSFLYRNSASFKLRIQQLKAHSIPLYTHRNNFLKDELLLWLMTTYDWPVPTYKEIKEYQIELIVARCLAIKERKIIEYKLACLPLLKNSKAWMYKVVCFHLLHGQRIDGEKSFEAIQGQLDDLASEYPYIFLWVRLCTRLYWSNIDNVYLGTTGNLSLDIFCVPALMTWTKPGLLAIASSWLMCIGVAYLAR